MPLFQATIEALEGLMFYEPLQPADEEIVRGRITSYREGVIASYAKKRLIRRLSAEVARREGLEPGGPLHPTHEGIY